MDSSEGLIFHAFSGWMLGSLAYLGTGRLPGTALFLCLWPVQECLQHGSFRVVGTLIFCLTPKAHVLRQGWGLGWWRGKRGEGLPGELLAEAVYIYDLVSQGTGRHFQDTLLANEAANHAPRFKRMEQTTHISGKKAYGVGSLEDTIYHKEIRFGS